MAVPSCLPCHRGKKDNLPWLLKASGSRAGMAAMHETQNNHIKNQQEVFHEKT
jgi:hypothetical protein